MRLSYPSFRTAATVLTLAALAACSSSKKDDAPAPTTPMGMSWTVDGLALSTTTIQSQKGSGILYVDGKILTVITYPTSMNLSFPTAVGTYVFGPSSTASAFYATTVPGTGTVDYYAGPSFGAGPATLTGAGTIVVTALTATTVTGTFTFTGIGANSGGTKSIINGKFNVGL